MEVGELAKQICKAVVFTEIGKHRSQGNLKRRIQICAATLELKQNESPVPYRLAADSVSGGGGG